MNDNSLLYFIGEYLFPDDRPLFEGAAVRSISLSETGDLKIDVDFPSYIGYRKISKTAHELRLALENDNVDITEHYPAECLNGDVTPDLVAYLKDNRAAANGFIDNVPVDFDGDRIVFHIARGSGILEKIGAAKFL